VDEVTSLDYLLVLGAVLSPAWHWLKPHSAFASRLYSRV